MSTPQRPLVIAVAGAIGSGKSTLTVNLARRLPGAATLHFDDYETASYTPMRELEAWLARGGSVAEFEAPGFAEAIGALLAGKTIHHPQRGTTSAAQHYLVLEMPLGREHPSTADTIDALIWLDTPPDVCLGRHVQKLTANMVPGTVETRPEGAADAFRFVRWLERYLDNYMGVVRRVLEVQRKAVRPRADIILDGSAAADNVAEAALRALGPWLDGRPGPA